MLKLFYQPKKPRNPQNSKCPRQRNKLILIIALCYHQHPNVDYTGKDYKKVEFVPSIIPVHLPAVCQEFENAFNDKENRKE